MVMRERDLADEEAVRLRNVIRWQRKELRSRLGEVERGESEWKRMVDEKANDKYKYENDIVTDTATRDASSPLLYQVYGSPRSGTDLSLQGTYNQLLERQVILKRYLRFKVNEDFKRKLEEDVSCYERIYLRLSPREEGMSCKTLLQRMVFKVKTKLKSNHDLMGPSTNDRRKNMGPRMIIQACNYQ
ncbi:hypothetical protein HPP92_006294 [Vanilla planifolia]|uniref:Uncharacterized protein n=1 Tax=Vanilla planifolia TaxID=51239 RepID=A0A835RVK5_VANPL|nr:hypothetical protein HPP92_006294 [Vanilla planifolia]